MDSAEGNLCDTCSAAWKGETRIKDRNDYFQRPGHCFYDRYHHQSYRDLVTSKESGCFICTWLWTKLLPPPQTGEAPAELSAAFDGFRVHCRLFASTLCFHVVCPWAADIELEVDILNKTDPHPPSREGAFYCTGSPPPPVWTKLDERPWSLLDANIGSSQSLQTIKDWVSSCDKNHKHCRPTSSKSGAYFPTRAIDVDKVELGIVHLCNREDVDVQHDAGNGETRHRQRMYPPYWTLSHRWGDPKQIPQLLLSTEHRFRNGIPVNDLTPTFGDAAQLVHRLGYRYLWIDSLCVFQDSFSDWQQESKVMVDVYRHSLCNISAIASSYDPGGGGLFRKRTLDARFLFPFKVDGELLKANIVMTEGPWIVWRDSVWNDEVESAPLNARGWVVQERFLAPRTTHFTKNQIFWECLESMRCEADPTGELLILHGKRAHYYPPSATTPYKQASLELARTKAGPAGLGDQPREGYRSDSERRHSHWGSIVSIYAACALTNESDKLIAMAGIAKTFQEVDGDTYLAGLWKRTIHVDLAWNTNASGGAQVRRSESYAPTWSWASVTRGDTLLYHYFGGVSLIRLLEARIVPEPPGGDPMGLLRSAELDIECMLHYYRWIRKSNELSVYTDEARTQSWFEKWERKEIFLDTADLVRKFKEMEEREGVCVPILGIRNSYGGSNLFLMLEHDSKSRFKRIGIFQCVKMGRWIDGWSGQRTRLTLV